MSATEKLKEEHEAILLLLNILEAISSKLQDGKEVQKGDLEKIMEFIQVFADKCHHGKEEGLLFPALQKWLPRNDGPIAMMLMEHDLGRDYIQDLKKAIKQEDTELIIENLENYITLLREHIDKENNILYQIADMHLSGQKQIELVGKFEKLEEEKIGKGKHEEFHKLLEDLKTAYL